MQKYVKTNETRGRLGRGGGGDKEVWTRELKRKSQWEAWGGEQRYKGQKKEQDKKADAMERKTNGGFRHIENVQNQRGLMWKPREELG